MAYEYLKKTLLKKDYRTSVINDFSIVNKAVFYIFEVSSGGNFGYLDDYKNYEIIKKLPVQINPSELKSVVGTGTTRAWGASIGNNNSENLRTHTMRKHSRGSGDEDFEEANIKLNYNMYDEYMITTMDGMITSDDCHLMSPTATSLKILQNYAGIDKFRTLFKWGPNEYFGFLKNVDCTYTAFSRWGEPLAAEAYVNLALDNLERTSNDYEPASVLEKLNPIYKTKIESSIESETMLNKAALGLTQAMR